MLFNKKKDSFVSIEKKLGDKISEFEKIKYFTKKYANPWDGGIKYDRTKDWDFGL